MGHRKFAISDIHGCIASFRALLQQLDMKQGDELYLLGDYIDRGPDSKGVLDSIWMMQQKGYTVNCLRGNHEQMMLDGRANLKKRELWAYNGGHTTMASFGTVHLSQIPKPYFDFMESLPYYLEVDNYLLVHAGLNFNTDPLEDKDAMIWIRRWYADLDKEWLGDRIIVHGHTPIATSIIQQQHNELEQLPVLNIDNGCFVKKDPKY